MKKILFITVLAFTVLLPCFGERVKTDLGYTDQVFEIVAIKEYDDRCMYQLSNGFEVNRYSAAISIDYGKKTIDHTRSIRIREEWQKAQVGQKVRIERCETIVKFWFYMPVKGDDYSIKKVVKKVSKYDGSYAELKGSTHGGFLVGSSGEIKGQAMESQDFFINIYFEKGDPISVNAKENPLWLDIQVGDTILEQRINGLVIRKPLLH